MGLKDLLVKLGILKVGGNAGTFKNASERTEVMGTEDTGSVDVKTEPSNTSED